ncbi:MAG: heavy metal translocating P-type ATPase, partial [Thermoleophilia bacterium]|nr:heavy metal translocating P-type ATPase [Thermoleophilia bacterium]
PSTRPAQPVAPARAAAPAAAAAAPAPVQTLRVGSRGPAVTALKAELRSQKYAIDGGDTYTQSTRDAVMAFQKINGLDRDGIAGPQTQRALAAGDPKRPQLGRGTANRVDVDLGTQTLTVVRGGEIAYIVNATSGNPNLRDGQGIATPSGTFNVQRKIAGTRHAPLGDLYYPSYFRGGVAVHGSNTIVAQRDSHGCVRIPRHLEQRVYEDMPVGSQVVVHA